MTCKKMNVLPRLAAAVLALLFLAPIAARAQGDIYVHAGQNFKPVTIAVTPLAGDDLQLAQVISNDFAHSVFLQPLDPTTFPEKIANPDVRPNIDAWKTINAQFVVTGRMSHQGGRATAQFRLWDTANGEQVAGQQYTTDADNGRRVAHMIADAIFTRVTGEKGFFDSHVVFVDETGPKEHRRKRLAIMDQDGANVKYLTRGEDLVVTPRFSPSAQEVTYMSFGNSDPRVSLLNIETGQREVVGNFPGMTFAPRYSPDGQRVILSLSEGATSNLYAMDLRTKAATRLTDTGAIDTSPSYSPDGGQIVFESDPRRLAADLCDERRRRPGKTHLLRRRPLFNAGLGAARRPDRLYQADRRSIRDRRDEAGWFGRAYFDRRLPQ